VLLCAAAFDLLVVGIGTAVDEREFLPASSSLRADRHRHFAAAHGRPPDLVRHASYKTRTGEKHRQPAMYITRIINKHSSRKLGLERFNLVQAIAT
jgi:hypothetical protein